MTKEQDLISCVMDKRRAYASMVGLDMLGGDLESVRNDMDSSPTKGELKHAQHMLDCISDYRIFYKNTLSCSRRAGNTPPDIDNDAESIKRYNEIYVDTMARKVLTERGLAILMESKSRVWK